MKKFFSISFALLILISGMHLTIASHICGGVVAATKFSLTGEKATCGMEVRQTKCSANDVKIESDCCKDIISIFTVDSNYAPSFLQLKEITGSYLQILFFPVVLHFQFFKFSSFLHTNVSPPDQNIASAVSLPDICVFRK